MRLVTAWHRDLAHDRQLKSLGIRKDAKWEPSGIGAFEKQTGSIEENNYKLIQIKEITSYKGLAEEGRRMKHCVRSYAQSCIDGRRAIFSFVRADLWNAAEGKNSLTLEVDLNVRSICQIRGFENRKPLSSEMKFIQEWAQVERLTVSRYLS